jgi:hypothetical protein
VGREIMLRKSRIDEIAAILEKTPMCVTCGALDVNLKGRTCENFREKMGFDNKGPLDIGWRKECWHPKGTILICDEEPV